MTTVLAFLRNYGLESHFKMNIEANHATLAAHTFQHELCAARINGVFGKRGRQQGDPMLGWDTDQFPTNVYDTTLAMYEILLAGGFAQRRLNFDAKVRRGIVSGRRPLPCLHRGHGYVCQSLPRCGKC